MRRDARTHDYEREGGRKVNGPQTIPEFMIAKWMKDNGLQPGKFGLQVKGNKGVISDTYGATIDVRYDPETKTVFLDI